MFAILLNVDLHFRNLENLVIWRENGAQLKQNFCEHFFLDSNYIFSMI